MLDPCPKLQASSKHFYTKNHPHLHLLVLPNEGDADLPASHHLNEKPPQHRPCRRASAPYALAAGALQDLLQNPIHLLRL